MSFRGNDVKLCHFSLGIVFIQAAAAAAASSVSKEEEKLARKITEF